MFRHFSSHRKEGRHLVSCKSAVVCDWTILRPVSPFAPCAFQCRIKKKWHFILPGILQVCDERNPSSKNLKGLLNRFASKPEGIRLQISPFSTELYCTSPLRRFIHCEQISLSKKRKNHYDMLLLLFRHYSHLISEMLYYFGPYILSIINNFPSFFKQMGLLLGPFQMCNFWPRLWKWSKCIQLLQKFSSRANWVEKFPAWVLTLKK